MLAGPDDGAPANFTGNTTACPSHIYAGPSAMPWSDGSRQPVPCGLAVASQEPAAVDGAVGGSGSLLTARGSGFGAGGLLRTSGMKSLAQAHWAARFQVPTVLHALPLLKSSRPESWHFRVVPIGDVSLIVLVVTPELA